VVTKLVAMRRKEKKVLLSSATASRAAVKKPAVVLTVDSDSEEEGEPVEGQEAGYEEREENPWIVVKKMATRNERRTHGRHARCATTAWIELGCVRSWLRGPWVIHLHISVADSITLLYVEQSYSLSI
jgi:hypothetical protein